jgi:hypothetical protein
MNGNTKEQSTSAKQIHKMLAELEDILNLLK